MGTATKPLPDHGTPARANGVHGGRPPCYCEPCRFAIRAARKRRKVNRELGRPALIDATPARDHLTLLHRTMCWRTLAASTTCDASNLMAIYRGDNSQITRATHRKIMAVQPTTEPDSTVCVDATPSRRRIQALQAVGHPYRVIARASGCTDTRLSLIAEGQPTVRKAVADRIADAYRQLAYKAPTFDRHTSRTRNNAAAKGWHGPLAWDEVTINDPAATPDTDNPPDPDLKRDELAELRRDEIWLLATARLDDEEIATRIGMAAKSVQAIRAELRTGRKRDRTKAAA